VNSKTMRWIPFIICFRNSRSSPKKSKLLWYPSIKRTSLI